MAELKSNKPSIQSQKVGVTYGTGIVAVEGYPEARSPAIVVGVVYPDGCVGVTVTTA